jgi:hypothetical protein
MSTPRPTTGTVFLFLAAAALVAGPAIAATSELPVAQSVAPESAVVDAGSEVSRAPFQKSVHVQCGNGFTSCYTDVYKVPRNHRLELKNVGCSFTLRAPGYITDATVVTANNRGGTFSPVVPVKLGESGGFQDFAFNTQLLLYGAAKTTLFVSVGGKNDISNLNCMFAGELIELE